MSGDNADLFEVTSGSIAMVLMTTLHNSEADVTGNEDQFSYGKDVTSDEDRFWAEFKLIFPTG